MGRWDSNDQIVSIKKNDLRKLIIVSGSAGVLATLGLIMLAVGYGGIHC